MFLQTLLLSLTAFLGTNLDDLIVSALLFSTVEGKQARLRIALGKYIGLGLLILFSSLAALGLGALPGRAVSLLGLIPIALGLRELWRGSREPAEQSDAARDPASGRALVRNAALVTVSNGADNIGVYIPLFTGFSGAEYAVFCGVFGLLLALWCILGDRLARLPLLRRVIEGHRRLLVPAVYLLLGGYILLKGLL